MMCKVRLICRFPARDSRCRTLSPDEASIGAVPFQDAKWSRLGNRVMSPTSTRDVANDAAVTLRYPCRDLVVRRDEPRDVLWEVWRVAVELMDLHQQLEAGRRVLHRLLAYEHKTNANGIPSGRARFCDVAPQVTSVPLGRTPMSTP